jgi:hypothetical protein
MVVRQNLKLHFLPLPEDGPPAPKGEVTVYGTNFSPTSP